MRIDGWEIDAFGPISGWTERGLAEHGVVVVAGDNETGKSALFEFLTTALFGFAPATAAKHPYSPWDGLQLRGARCSRIWVTGAACASPAGSRRSPQGTLSRSTASSQNLANRPVPWVGGLARAVFTNLHAVTQNEALGMDSRTWQSVEDRMLGGASFDFLRPAREVVEQLSRDCRGLWLPTQQRHPRAFQIRQRIRALGDELRPAEGRRAEIETKRDRLAEIAELLEAIERGPQGRRSIKVMLARDAALAPIVPRARRAARLDAEAESFVANDDFDPDPRADRDELREIVESCEQRGREVEREIEQAGEALEIDPAIRAVLAARTAIEELRSEIPLHRQDEKRIERMSLALQRKRGTFEQLAGQVLDGPVDDDALVTLRALGRAEARGRYEDWSAADADYERHAADRRRAAETTERAQRERDDLGDVPDRATADARVQTLRDLDRAEVLAGAAIRTPSPLWRALVPVLVALAGVAAIVAGVILGGAVLAILASAGASLIAGAGVDLTRTVRVRRRSGMSRLRRRPCASGRDWARA